MFRKRFEPRNLIVHYCFAMVLSGCVGVSLNRHLFETDLASRQPIEVTAEASTSATEAQPDAEQAPAPDLTESDECPNHQRILESIRECRLLIDDTVNLTKRLNKQDGNSDLANSRLLAEWRAKVIHFKANNDNRLKNCGLLLGSTGVQVFPEIPLALENLKRAGTWLDWAVVSQQFGESQDTSAYIASANRAMLQAHKLITHKLKPKSKNAIVQLPRTLEKLTVSSL